MTVFFYSTVENTNITFDPANDLLLFLSTDGNANDFDITQRTVTEIITTISTVFNTEGNPIFDSFGNVQTVTTTSEGASSTSTIITQTSSGDKLPTSPSV